MEKETKNEKRVSNEHPWSTGKLIIGIISMALFIFICFQSCAAGIGNALEENGSSSGTAGFLCAIFMLTGGIVAVASRNKKETKGTIAATVIYFLGAIITIGSSKTFGDLAIWGALSFSFGLICLGSVLLKKEKFKNKSKIITIIVLIVSIISFVIGISTTNDDSKSSTSNEPKEEKTEAKKETTIGTPITHKGVYYTVTKVKHSSGDDWDTPQTGKEYVIVTVKIENKSSETVSYNEYDWKMENSNKQVEDCTYATFVENELSSGDLKPGGVKEGNLVFEEPKNDQELKLLYYDNSLFDENETFIVTLK